MRIVKFISAKAGNTFESRIKNTLHHILKEDNKQAIVKLDIIINNEVEEEFNEEYECFVETMKTVFKDKMPAHSIVFQHIPGNEEFVIHYQVYENTNIQYKKLLNHHYVTVKHDAGIELFSGAISFKEDSLLFSAQRCFDFAEQILMAEDLNFGHIYRQWNYIPQINGLSDYDRQKRANIYIFNEIKNIFFEEALLINGNPLESDINNLDRRLSIDFNALGPYPENTHTKLKDKENYTQENTGIKSKFIYNDSHEYWFTSASDHDHISHDIEQQTIQTLKNIFTLKEKYKVEPNIQDHCKFIKVKIKNSEDCKTVKN